MEVGEMMKQLLFVLWNQESLLGEVGEMMKQSLLFVLWNEEQGGGWDDETRFVVCLVLYVLVPVPKFIEQILNLC